MLRDRQELDNQSLLFQNSKKEENISAVKNDIVALTRKLNDYAVLERDK